MDKDKDLKITVTEYANSLSDEEARWLADKLRERLVGDLAESLKMMSRNKRMDAMLSAVVSANGLFDICDQITDVFQQICKKRGLIKSPRVT